MATLSSEQLSSLILPQYRIFYGLLITVPSNVRRMFHSRDLDIQLFIFTALHVMQTRYCDEISVCPSVCLSVCLSHACIVTDKTVQRSVQIYIPYERTFSLPSFLRRRMVGGGLPLLPEILSQPAPVGTKSPIFNQ